MDKLHLDAYTKIILTVIAVCLLWMCVRDVLNIPAVKSQGGITSLLDAIGEENVLGVQQHIDAGTNPDKWFIPPGYPFAGAAALHLAIVTGNEKIVRLLIDNGANKEIKAKDKYGGTPLQWAAFFGKKDMTKLMVSAGVNINAADNNGCTPLCAAHVPNPFVEQTEAFKKDRVSIQKFLESQGGKTSD